MAAPVLFLTARGALTDRLSGFHAGGDDYLTKPFALAELVVRVQALARRGGVERPASPVVTRPLGASIGDFLSQSSKKFGGLGLGPTHTSYLFLGCILALVTYLTVTRRDQTPPDLVAAEA